MKIAILYATKTGTTEKCAVLLAEKLTNTTLIDLKKNTPNIDSFDCIIIGGSIRMGALHKAAKSFINKNAEILKGKLTAYFICCGSLEKIEEIFTKNISKDLLEASIGYETFGGEMDINNQKGFDKFIVKMVTKDKNTKKPKILDENIEKFSKKIMTCLENKK